MDSSEGKLKESVSELEEGIGVGVGGAQGRPLPKHLGHETGHLMGDSVHCDQGLGVLLQVCTDSRLQGLLSVSEVQGLLSVSEVMTSLPKACEGLFTGLCSFCVAMSIKNLNISALLHLGGKQVFIHNLFSLLSSCHTDTNPLALPLPFTLS